jgi:hypothetical protein
MFNKGIKELWIAFLEGEEKALFLGRFTCIIWIDRYVSTFGFIILTNKKLTTNLTWLDAECSQIMSFLDRHTTNKNFNGKKFTIFLVHLQSDILMECRVGKYRNSLCVWLGCHLHLNPMGKEISEGIFSWGPTSCNRIEFIESNGFRRKISIGSQSYTNPLKILWIEGALNQ